MLFIDLPRNAKDMNRSELLAAFPEGTDKSFLMRSIIMSEVRFPQVNYDRTLRSLWYSTVKPTLDKLGLLEESDQTEEGLTKWDATLSRYVADLLRRGYLTYKKLHISDTSRQKENPRKKYYCTSLDTYGYQVTAAPYSNIIIATEKDTVYNIISDLAELFGCSCISSKGQNALGAMEKLIRGMARPFHTVHILTMTDYDPAGYYIADALATQARDILDALSMHHVDVNIKRIGITPDQLSPEMVDANKYTPKPANLDKWYEMTGGIDGEPKGLELDALTPTQIREIFVDKIVDYVDPSTYEAFVKQSYIQKRTLEAMEPFIRRVLDAAIAEVEDDLETEALDIAYYARRGFSSIPVSSLCNGGQDWRILQLAKEYFPTIELSDDELPDGFEKPPEDDE